jgi:hypothetical protein
MNKKIILRIKQEKNFTEGMERNCILQMEIFVTLLLQLAILLIEKSLVEEVSKNDN